MDNVKQLKLVIHDHQKHLELTNLYLLLTF